MQKKLKKVLQLKKIYYICNRNQKQNGYETELQRTQKIPYGWLPCRDAQGELQ